MRSGGHEVWDGILRTYSWGWIRITSQDGRVGLVRVTQLKYSLAHVKRKHSCQVDVLLMFSIHHPLGLYTHYKFALRQRINAVKAHCRTQPQKLLRCRTSRCWPSPLDQKELQPFILTCAVGGTHIRRSPCSTWSWVWKVPTSSLAAIQRLHWIIGYLGWNDPKGLQTRVSKSP